MPAPALVDVRPSATRPVWAAVAYWGERLARLIPPPSPVDLVELHLHVVERHGLSRSVQARDLDGVVDVGEQHVPRGVATRELEPDVAPVRGQREAHAVRAERAASLEDARVEARPQHAGCLAVERKGRGEAREAVIVELAFEERDGVGRDLPRGGRRRRSRCFERSVWGSGAGASRRRPSARRPRPR